MPLPSGFSRKRFKGSEFFDEARAGVLSVGEGQFCLQHRDDIHAPLGNEIIYFEAVADEVELAHMGEKDEQGFPEAVNVGKQNGFCVAAELGPGELLDEFFQRANTAGQSDKGIGAFEHELFAGVHVGDDDHVICAIEHDFALFEKFRDDACDFAAMIESSACESSHEADIAAAIDKADARFGQMDAELAGRAGENRIGAVAGTAIDADGLYF